ncbi:uncharacterized protein LOC117643760 [Thrips palmi]|uniref:Uncharacterized protein LOC117643760 n=1 Tax=Thrips palmi TaxID=161013 RepID=A0A6P8YNF4_THRPL|nr:uncharacterized protein LOC117643760 [Thrips palmi]
MESGRGRWWRGWVVGVRVLLALATLSACSRTALALPGGDDGADVAPSAEACSGHTCRMLCAYGFATDEKGCPLCRCYDPCSEIKCSGSLTCQLEEAASCSRPPCLPVPTCKKGRSLDNVCPAGAPLTMPGSGVPPRPFLCGLSPGQPRCPPLFECSVQPGNDYGVCCPGAARLDKPGACPARGEALWSDPAEDACGPGCRGDQDCPGPLKCCDSAECGGSACTPPANLTECRQLRQLAVQLSVSEREGRGYVPQCDPVTGAFRPRQCSRNGRVCWCVDRAGNKRPNSMATSASVHCLPHALEEARAATGRAIGGSPPEQRCTTSGRCAQVCELGFRVGADGCPTCECDDPCAGAVCGAGEECVAERAPDCDGPLCSATPICRPVRAQPARPASNLPANNLLAKDIPAKDIPADSVPTDAVVVNAAPTEKSVTADSSAEVFVKEMEDDAMMDEEEDRPASMCEYLRDFRDKMEGTRDGMSLALPPPSCRPDGSFNDTQCEAGACWCVDSFGSEIPQTRTKGAAPSPACLEVRESLTCLDLTCRLGCEFGFTLSPDTRCPLCECRDPCAEAKCGADAECHVVDVACDAEYCPPVPACLPKKPGQCPYLVPVSAGSCDYQCRSDYNCNETAKCCSNGCGTQCMLPVVMTECQHRRAILQHESHESGIPASKLWVPRCRESDGAYEEAQCHPGTGQCWCVDDHGQEVPGTRTENAQQPDCQAGARNGMAACPDLRCDQACPHGYQLDGRGCPTCRCRDPCQDLQCRGEGEACRMVRVQCADPPCHAVPMCLPRRENPCLAGQPLQQPGSANGLFLCGPSGEACPASHKCELSPLGEYAVCCPKPRDVCFEPVLKGPCEPGVERWRFNPERNACELLQAGQCGAAHNAFPDKDMCNKVCPVLSQCERLREKNQKAADKYKKWTFIPRCSAETGAWLPLQCLTQVGVCWCVAPDGQPIKGTLTRDANPTCPASSSRSSNRQARRRHDPHWADEKDPELAIAKLLRGLDPAVAELLQQHMAPDVEAPVVEALAGPPLPVSLPIPPERRTRCHALRDRAVDEASALQCDHNGGFAATQCLPKDDPDAECWCVDEAGNQLADTTTFKRGAQICLPTPIEAVEVSLGFLGEPGVVDSAAEPRVLDAVRALLASLSQATASATKAATRHEGLRVTLSPGRAVASFTLHGPGKVDTAFHLEEMVKSGALSVGHESGAALVADITQSRFSHSAAAPSLAGEDASAHLGAVALQHREIVSESTVPESYHTAILVLSAASAFVIVILAVLAALYRRRMLLSAKQQAAMDVDDDRFGLGPGAGAGEPVYVVRLPSPPPLDRHGRVLGVNLGVPLAQEDIPIKS